MAAALFAFRKSAAKGGPISMSEITALKRQKRVHSRVNVFLDGQFAFGVQEVLAAGLHVGQNLTDEQISRLKGQDENESAYERALNYLSYRPRSEREVYRYLSRRGVTDDVREKVLARLRGARLVDDAEFSRFWVENRRSFRPRGVWALRSELRQKGVDSASIESALEGIDEEADARRAGERALGRFSRLDQTTFRRRLLGYLQRRGFGYGISRRTVDLLWAQVEAQEGEGTRPDSGTAR